MPARMLSGPVVGGPRAGAKRIDAPNTWDGRVMTRDHRDPSKRKYERGHYEWHTIGCWRNGWDGPHWCWIDERPRKPKLLLDRKGSK